MTEARKNELPGRAAKRIMAVLFPAEYASSDPIRIAMMDVWKGRLELDIVRAIYAEMVAIEGEKAVEAREGRLPQ